MAHTQRKKAKGHTANNANNNNNNNEMFKHKIFVKKSAQVKGGG